MCEIFLSDVYKCYRCSRGAGSSSRGARRELREVFVKYFLCVSAILALLGQCRTTVVVLAPEMVGGFKVLY